MHQKNNVKIESVEFVKGIKGTNSILGDGRPHVAFVGRSNVGKSSVINALLNRKNLVAVGKRAGKTTEINFFLVNGKFYFVDLPGYGYAQANLKAREKIRKLILWYLTSGEARLSFVALIVDIRAGLTDFDKEMLEILRAEGHLCVIVANKIDKLNQKETAKKLATMRKESGGTEIFPHSAETKKGTDVLREKLLRQI